MRWAWVGVVLLIAAVTQIHAAKPVTVEQLGQLVDKQVRAHRKDTSVASSLDKVELSERLTELDLNKILEKSKPGSKTEARLRLLAAETTFLNPPADVLVNDPVPEHGAQQALWNSVAEYGVSTQHRLPDFLATRETRMFNNLPYGFQPGFVLHLDRKTSRVVTYRNGAEVTAPEAGDPANRLPNAERFSGLESSGEFGTLLEIVLTDLQKGQLRWSHWEQTPKGTAAVFTYSIAEERSHFHVGITCCTTGTALDQTIAQRGYDELPGYHGNIAVDPATGEVTRLTIVAELPKESFIQRIGIAIGYERKSIGEKSYMCPVKSVALLGVQLDMLQGETAQQNIAKMPGMSVRMSGSEIANMATRKEGIEVLWLNEVEFKNYHRFGATVRILNGDAQ
ncbi:MAG: hypothetical protein P4K83_10825 [Terracidiphilus sp.]|nr:hypothetical protein [Terracidiphilus sp.]